MLHGGGTARQRLRVLSKGRWGGGVAGSTRGERGPEALRSPPSRQLPSALTTLSVQRRRSPEWLRPDVSVAPKPPGFHLQLREDPEVPSLHNLEEVAHRETQLSSQGGSADPRPRFAPWKARTQPSNWKGASGNQGRRRVPPQLAAGEKVTLSLHGSHLPQTGPSRLPPALDSGSA